MAHDSASTNRLAHGPLNWAIRLHEALYRWTGGRLGGRMGPLPTLLLTTTGRKSGQPRTIPLIYFPAGDRLVVVASNGGQDQSPAWYLNLRAHSAATVQIGREQRVMHGVVASPALRARLWPQVVACNPAYAGYERKTAREIPLVILSPGL
jgi:F420H(2)-dependent quinone reductase